MDVALATDESAYLSVCLPGNLRELPGKLVGEDPVKGDFATVKLLDSPDLAGFQAGYVAVNSVYLETSDNASGSGNEEQQDVPQFLAFPTLAPRSYLNLCGLILRSMVSRNLDQLSVLNEETSFRAFPAPHFGQEKFPPSSLIL
jgi:hypothetical protein